MQNTASPWPNLCKSGPDSLHALRNSPPGLLRSSGILKVARRPHALQHCFKYPGARIRKKSFRNLRLYRSKTFGVGFRGPGSLRQACHRRIGSGKSAKARRAGNDGSRHRDNKVGCKTCHANWKRLPAFRSQGRSRRNLDKF